MSSASSLSAFQALYSALALSMAIDFWLKFSFVIASVPIASIAATTSSTSTPSVGTPSVVVSAKAPMPNTGSMPMTSMSARMTERARDAILFSIWISLLQILPIGSVRNRRTFPVINILAQLSIKHYTAIGTTLGVILYAR